MLSLMTRDLVHMQGPASWQAPSVGALDCGIFPSIPALARAEDECRGGAVSGVECRPERREMPIYAALCRWL